MSVNDALNAVREGKLSTLDAESLRCGLMLLVRHHEVIDRGAHMKVAIDSFEAELSRRRHQENSKSLHDLEMTQGKSHHGETMSELEKLKTSVDRLAGARWIDWAILIAGGIAAIAAVILLFR